MAPHAKAGRCLYEVLDLAKDCEEDEIKKAYRRQALIWHPGEQGLVCCHMLASYA